jgi:hypothetical protein
MLKTVSSITNALGALNYNGTWNASTNSPTLTSSVGTKGDYYVVSVAGTTNLNGIALWSVGDWAVFNGSTWQKVNGGTSESFTSITVTGTSTLADVTATTVAASGKVTELGYNVPYTLFQSGVPFIITSSGVMGNNGALSGITALSTTFPQAYIYLPAGAISSGSAAGWYYTVFSSTTAGTVYNNVYTSGTPTVPASPSAFVTTGPGAFVQTTGFITSINPTVTIPANSMTANGRVEITLTMRGNNTAQQHYVRAYLGGAYFAQISAFGQASPLTDSFIVQNTGVINSQYWGWLTGAIGQAASGPITSIDYTIAQGIYFQNSISLVTDTVELISASVKVFP